MNSEHLLVVKVPERLLPVERGERYDEPLSEVLEQAGIGFVNGGGTKTTRDGDIEYCYLDVQVTDLEHGMALIHSFLRRVGAPAATTITEYEPGKFADALTNDA